MNYDYRQDSYSSVTSDGSIATAPIPYVQIKILGEGSYGKAVLYRNTQEDCLVVWKEITIQKDRQTVIQSEIDILSLLDHPNIIGYYNHFICDNIVYIEMEYANSGTLVKLIKDNQDLLPESDVLWWFYQLILGLAYIHKLNIIHRDIKPHNIFIHKNTILKIGDFGISKQLQNEDDKAQTQIGTPLYSSPELLNGQSYCSKTDIWSCACVLYELMSHGRHLFDSSNHLFGIVNRITNLQFEPMPTNYNKGLLDLMNKMLLQEPNNRPNCEEILNDIIWSDNIDSFTLKLNQFNGDHKKLGPRPGSGTENKEVLAIKSEVFIWGAGKLAPMRMDCFSENKIVGLKVAASRDHYALVTIEGQLYTWSTNSLAGTGTKGQIGHGNSVYKTPRLVNDLLELTIQNVCCGIENTFCVASVGQIFGCGSNYYGQLGQDPNKLDHSSIFTAIQIINPNNGTPENISKISCGTSHVLALSTDLCRVYSWGCGEYGRLGNGSEDDSYTPNLVDFPIKSSELNFSDIICGPDTSFVILSMSGRVLTCGNNEYNKLGLEHNITLDKISKIKQYDIEIQTKFKCITSLGRNVIQQIACGLNHSVFLNNYGHLYVCGDNRKGQLGLGDLKKHNGICRSSKMLYDMKISRVSCGDYYTIVATNDNNIYSWGLIQDGRLGHDGGVINQISVTNPRAILGTLWKCGAISSGSEWQTIMLAEQIVTSNLLSTTIDNCDNNNVDDNDITPTRTWLKQELDNNEVIYMDDARYTNSEYPALNDNSENHNCCNCVKELKDKIQELEKELEKRK